MSALKGSWYQHIKQRWHISLFNQIIVLITFFFFGFWALDPLIALGAKSLDPSVRPMFKSVTQLGRTEWVVVPCLIGIMASLLLRRHTLKRRYQAAYSSLIQIFAYIALAVCLPGLISSLLKNMIGRARPKFLDSLGSMDFTPFAFTADFASFPSGHVTTIFAFATAIAYLWPKAGITFFALAFWVAVTRIFLEAHYFTDVVAGALIGALGAWFIAMSFARKGWTFQIYDTKNIILKNPHVVSWFFRKIAGRLNKRPGKVQAMPEQFPQITSV